MQPLVTVIIPTYNRGDLLRAALTSVMAQTFRQFTVLVVDDGSSEDLRPVIGSFGQAVHHLRVEHGGAARARNAGIEAAESDLVAFLDSDDLWLPEHLARTVPILQQQPRVGLVYHDMVTIDEVGRPVPSRRSRPCPSGRVTADLFAYDFIPTPSVVCRRDLLRQAGCFDPVMVPSEDYDLWLKISLLCEFAGLPEPLMQRRQHGGNISRQHKARNEVVRAILKERFWRDPAGRAGLGKDLARNVLAKAFYRAGRLLLKGGWPGSARRFLRRSRQYRPLYARALFWQTVAACAGRAEAPGDPSDAFLRLADYRLE